MIDKTSDAYKLECYQQALQYIIDTGFDYDGRLYMQSLKELIDELVHTARSGLKLELPQYIGKNNLVYVYYQGKSIEVPEKEYSEEVKNFLKVMEQIKENKTNKLFDKAIEEAKNMTVDEYNKLYEGASL